MVLQYGVDTPIFLVTWYFILFLNFDVDTDGHEKAIILKTLYLYTSEIGVFNSFSCHFNDWMMRNI